LQPCEGNRGAGALKKRGREVCGKREKRGREAGFPRWREVGELGQNYAIFCNRKSAKRGGANKYRGTRVREVGGLSSPVPRPQLWKCLWRKQGKR